MNQTQTAAEPAVGGEEADDQDRFWWKHIPKGAEAIVMGIAAEQLFVDLLDARLKHNNDSEEPQPRKQQSEVVNFRALHHLIVNHPSLCHKTHEFRFEDEEENKRELTPLAALCVLQAPLFVVQAAVEANPAALWWKEPRKGSLPLHYACSFDAPLEVIEYLLKHDDDSCKMALTARNDGLIPLGLATYFKARLSTVQQLVTHSPSSISRVCEDPVWTALHATAACGKTELDVAQYLYAQHPNSISMQDHKGRTPLHLACSRKGNLPLIEFLIQQVPRGEVIAHDHRARSPVIYAARSQTLEVVEFLLDWHERHHDNGEYRFWSDRLGITLLHFAAYGNTVDVVEFLAKRCRCMLTFVSHNQRGYMPLHFACQFKAPLANIVALVEQSPRTLFARCRGETPLQVAQRCARDQSDPNLDQVILYLQNQMSVHEERAQT